MCRAIRGLSNYMFHEATRMAKVTSCPQCVVGLQGGKWWLSKQLHGFNSAQALMCSIERHSCPDPISFHVQESQTNAGDKHDG